MATTKVSTKLLETVGVAEGGTGATSASAARTALGIVAGASDTEKANIMLNAFRISVNGGLSVQNMVDGVVDEFEDETGVDTSTSTNEFYNATSDYYSNVEAAPTILLHGNGSDASTTFTDDGATGHTFVASGNAQLDTAQKKFGTASMLFDGTDDYIKATSHADFNIGSNDFSVEAWIRTSSSAGQAICSIANADNESMVVDINRGGANYINLYNDTSWLQFNTSSTVNITDGNWHKIEISRTGGTTYCFIDGVAKGSAADVTSIVQGDFYIGGHWGGALYSDFNGHIDEFRFRNDTAGHTSGYTVETAEFGSAYNMTLVSDAATALAAPGDANIVIWQEDVDSITLNTDLKAYASRNGGTTYTQMTLAKEATIQDADVLTQITQGIGTAIGDMTANAGIAGCFDGTQHQDTTNSAQSYADNVVGKVGKDWGSGNTKTLTKAIVYSTTNTGFHQGTGISTTITIKGSNTSATAGFTALGNSGSFSSANSQAITITGLNTTTAYRWHIAEITASGTGTATRCSEVEFFEDVAPAATNILTGSVDISGQSSGTSMKYKIETLNTKEQKIHAVALQWS